MSKIPAKVAARDGMVYVKAQFEHKDTLRKSGFSWDAAKKLWCTPFIAYAKKLFPEAKAIEKVQEERKEAFAKTLKEKPAAPKGFTLKPFQKIGVAWLCAFKNVLLGDEMGLGKTVQAIVAINTLGITGDVLIVCPASLKLNWLRELSRWLCFPLKIEVIYGKTDVSKLDADVYIINYDIAMRKKDFLLSRKWEVIVCDESHYLKNTAAQRTKALLGERGKGEVKAERKWLLTGTPILNRPIELFAPLRYLAPMAFQSKERYARRYCAAGFDHLGYWDESGSSNESELKELLNEFIMIRRKKRDVLTDLPEKDRQIIQLEATSAAKKEAKLLAAIEGKFENIMEAVKGQFFDQGEHIMTVRRMTGLSKFKPACEHIDGYLEAGEKLVVFAVHKELIKNLSEKYKGKCVTITGDTPNKKRDENVKAFQEDDDVRIFFGNIQAAGVGLTLTAASHALMLELPWSPSEVVQAEDRLHRIGQENAVLIKYLVFENTIDSLLAQSLAKKTKVIKSILD